MSENQQYFDPENKTSHYNMAGQAERVLKNEQEPLDTPTLAAEIAPHNEHLSESTIRSKLYYAEDYIKDNYSVETYREGSGTGGDETIMWRYTG